MVKRDYGYKAMLTAWRTSSAELVENAATHDLVMPIAEALIRLADANRSIGSSVVDLAEYALIATNFSTIFALMES